MKTRQSVKIVATCLVMVLGFYFAAYAHANESTRLAPTETFTTSAPEPTPSPFFWDDMVIRTEGVIISADWESSGILRIEGATRVKIRSKIAGVVPGMIPILECAGAIKKLDTTIPIHHLSVEGELANFNGRNTFTRTFEAGGLGVVKMSGATQTETPYIKIIGRGGSSRKVNASIAGAILLISA